MEHVTSNFPGPAALPNRRTKEMSRSTLLSFLGSDPGQTLVQRSLMKSSSCQWLSGTMVPHHVTAFNAWKQWLGLLLLVSSSTRNERTPLTSKVRK